MGQLDMTEAGEAIDELHHDLLRVRVKTALLKSSTPEKEIKLRQIENLLEQALDIAMELMPEEV